MIGQPEKLCAIERADPIVAKKVRLVRARVAKLMGNRGLPEERCKPPAKPKPKPLFHV